jgi:hypothetical protein
LALQRKTQASQPRHRQSSPTMASTARAASAATLLLLAALPTVYSAQFHALNTPFYQGPSLLKRAASQDPSCPPGFLCDQQECPAGVLCPDGESCVNFEGTIACAPKAPQWCALNPSNLQGVGCAAGEDGICWSHLLPRCSAQDCKLTIQQPRKLLQFDGDMLRE